MLTNQGQTINLSQLVHATITSPNFISGLVPSLATGLAPAISQQIQLAMTPFTEKINNMEKEVGDVKRELGIVKDANANLTVEVGKLRESVSQLESSHEDLEQYGRRTSLRFHCVPLQ